jgi:hypothetical protein
MVNMSKREPIVVGGQTFSTKKDLRAHVVALRSRYPTGTTLAGPDATFMVELVARHEHAEEKIGLGIRAIEVSANSYGNPEFQIVRIDGSRTNLGVDKCVGTDSRSPLARFHEACRHAVADQIIAYKAVHLPPGVSPDSMHVHHLPPPFATMVQTFIAERGIDVASIAYGSGEGGAFYEGVHFRDETLLADWSRYHEQHARLTLLLGQEHERLHALERAARKPSLSLSDVEADAETSKRAS